jgi:SMODS-associating 2TM, beta-strand rich effector domain
MPTPGWTRAIIFLAAGLMLLLSLVTGDSIDQDGLRWLGGVISAVILLVLAFDQWLWRAPLIGHLSERAGHPLIRGTWRGILDYQRDGEGNPGQTEIYLAVRQTFSTVSVRCYFPKTGAESWSLTASLLRNDHRHDLHYIFQQEAPAPDRDVNRPTQGACQLAVAGRPVKELAGSYYAERGGKGKIDAREYSPSVAGSLPAAKSLTYLPRS